MTTLPCNLCGRASGSPLVNTGEFEVVRCDFCGLAFVNRAFASDELAALYDEGYYNSDDERLYSNYLGEAGKRISSSREKVAQLRRFARGGRLLEVGCAAGFFLEAAREHFDVEGVELSAFASDHARRVLGHSVHTGTVFSAQFAAGSFDAVVLWDVIEHVADPRGLLAEIRRVLKPGGVIALTTGNIDSFIARRDLANWRLLAPPYHLFYFSTQTMRVMLGSLGFTCLEMTTNGVFSTKTSRLTQNRLIAVITGWLRKGDIMTVYARRGAEAG